MAHDASGGVDGDGLLLDWLLAHGFNCRGPVSCRAGSGRIIVGREQGVEEGPGLGGGEGGRGGARVVGRDRHDARVGRWTVGGMAEYQQRQSRWRDLSLLLDYAWRGLYVLVLGEVLVYGWKRGGKVGKCKGQDCLYKYTRRIKRLRGFVNRLCMNRKNSSRENITKPQDVRMGLILFSIAAIDARRETGRLKLLFILNEISIIIIARNQACMRRA